MKLLVILILVGHELSAGSTVSSKAERTKTQRISPLHNYTRNEKTDREQEITDKHHGHLPVDEFAKTRLQHVTSEELFEKPKRERETDKDFLKNVIREILSYNRYKHLVLRDSNARKKRLHFGIQIGYNENESACATDEKVPVNSVSEEITYDGLRSVLPKARKRLKNYQGHYVPGRSRRVSKQGEQVKDTSNVHSFKDLFIKLSKILKKYDKNKKNVEEGLSDMVMDLTKYLQYSEINKKYKNLGDSKGTPINKEADMAKENRVVKAEVNKDLVNRIILEVKLLLATHKDKSNLYVTKILDIITKNQEFLIPHPDQTCGEAKINYLIHTLNIAYHKYLTNAECEGEYLDTGLDLIGWISLNKIYIKAKRDLVLNKGKIDRLGDNESSSASRDNKYQSSSDYTSDEARLVKISDSSENKNKNKFRHINRSLTNDDSVNLKSKEFEYDEDHQDPNKEVLDLNIKSRLLRPSRSAIFHRSHPYYRNIEKLFTKQENANTVLDSIRLVCEKIASDQFLHSVEAIIWRLLENRDCKLENVFKENKHNIIGIKPLTIDIIKHQIEHKALDVNEESIQDDTSEFNDSSNLSDESSLIHNTEFDKNSQDDEDSYSDYDAVPLKFKQFVIPISEINIRSNHKRFRDLTHLRNDKLANIFGSGKINSLKLIKQKLKDLNINDYKKLMENLPVAEKLLKIIYSKLPPQLQTVLKVLKTLAREMVEDKKNSLKKIPSLLMEAFLKGKGQDLSKMMADKFEHEQSKKVGKLSQEFQDKTRLRYIVQSVSELAKSKINNFNMVVDKGQLEEKPEPSQLDTLPHIELSSSIEKKDQPIVELTYVFNHPPVIHYKPKFFVKHNITYDQYLKNIKNIYSTDLISTRKQIQLVRVVKKEGNDSQVFYETDIPNAAVEVSNKSALLELYDQFYNLSENNDTNSLPVEKLHEQYDNNKIKITETPHAAEDKFQPTVSTVSSMVSLKDTTEFQYTDVISEDIIDSTSKNNEFSMKNNGSRSEEVFFGSVNSAEVDNMEKPKPKMSSDEHIARQAREGLIQWNNYPINKPKYNNRRKISQNHQKNEQPEN